MAKSWRHSLLPILLTGVVVGLSVPAWADHSLGRACLTCHSLRSTNVKTGSRNIACSNINDPFYGYNELCASNTVGTYWYCPSINSTSQWTPGNGEPLDCSYCHDASGDIGDEIGRATGATTAASAHLVDVRGTSVNTGAIRCNDCHNNEVNPNAACDKAGPEDGYPNHLNVAGSTPAGLDTGTNARIGAAAHLDTNYKYGDALVDATYGVNWSGDIAAAGNTPLCFKCHRTGGAVTATDVQSDYTSFYGGHNIVGYGAAGNLATRKLPCYDCHDPHAANGNEKLIIDNEDTPRNPYNTSYANYSPPNAFTAVGDDYKVCITCHDGGRTVEGVAIADVVGVGVTPITSIFPFHANAHAEVTATSNCLQNFGGCHQSPHNTDIFRCLDCHSKAVTDAITTVAAPATAPARLVAVNHIDSEFGHIGAIGPNKIQSVHTIPYAAAVWLPGQGFPTTDASLDMRLPANNGCMYCHNAVGQAANTIVVGDGGPALTGSRANNFTGARETLSLFDAFCLSCHDGGGPTFTVGSYTLSDDSSTGSNVNFSAGTLYPPQVNNKTGVGDGYFYTAGHGRGLLGSPSTAYPPASGTPSPNSNPGAEIPCLECHMYHGSTAYKLLPGWRESNDGTAHVLKGGLYPPKLSTGVESTSTLNPIGGATNSAVIDYTDYTNPTYSRAESDYRNNNVWSSYAHSNTPTAQPTPFGSSGDLFNGPLVCNQDTANLSTPSGAGRTNGTKEIGFCNMCHLFNDGVSAPTDGATTTYSLAYSHRGDPLLVDCDGQSLGSKRTFWRDCLECHDPHGSGTDSSTGTANLYMVRARMKYDATNWTNVYFTSRGKDSPTDAGVTANSFDADDVTNTDDICNVCHTGLDWSNRTAGPSNSHMNGYRCTKCHRHGM